MIFGYREFVCIAGKQFSLDSRIDLVIHNWRQGAVIDDDDGGDDVENGIDGNCKPFDAHVEAIAEDVPDREGTNERYIAQALHLLIYCRCVVASWLNVNLCFY